MYSLKSKIIIEKGNNIQRKKIRFSYLQTKYKKGNNIQRKKIRFSYLLPKK